jgi:iron complex outermembrane receptor protein
MKLLRKPSLISLCAALVCLSCQAEAPAPLNEDLDSTDFAYPQVITPTRLKQSLSDVPASVTVVTAETIRRYGLTSIEEALRLVPGMAVTRIAGGDYRINYHGTDVVNPRRLNVLIDGVSVYHPAFSRVDWSMLPVALEDVDRIEVTRGPNSAAYGPNSMMAVINILTKHPKDVETAMVSGSLGTHYAGEATLRVARQFGDTHAYVTLNTLRDSGFDRSERPVDDAHDSHAVQRLNLRMQTDLGGGSSLELHGALKTATNEVTYVSDPFRQTYPDQAKEETLLSGKWSMALSGDHEVQVKAFHSRMTNEQDWRTCLQKIVFAPKLRELFLLDPVAFGNAFSDFVKTGQIDFGDVDPQLLNGLTQALNQVGGITAFQDVCGTMDQNTDERRTQIELQDTYVVSDQLRLVGGLGLRRQEADSDNFFGPGNRLTNTVRWLFGHAEYRPTKALTLNLGGYGETNSLGSDTFSPRLALNFHLSDYQTLRAVYSRGTRTPDLAEVRGYWTPYLRNTSPQLEVTPTPNGPSYSPDPAYVFASFYGNPNLKPERISSRELGYLLTLPKSGLSLDARIFDDRLTDLISSYSDFSVRGATNDGYTRLTGAETQLNWDIASGWSSWLSYAYLLNHQTSRMAERGQFSRNSGALGLSRQLPGNWRISGSHYFSSGDGSYERRYGRTDMSLTHQFSLGKNPASASLVASYLHTRRASTYVSESGIGYISSSYNDPLAFSGTVRLSF